MPANPKPKRIKPESAARKYVAEVVIELPTAMTKKEIRTGIWQTIIDNGRFCDKAGNWHSATAVRVQNIDERQL